VAYAEADISILSSSDIKTMNGVSMHDGCPVGYDMLRVVTVKHRDFHGNTKNGKLIVHMDIANDVEKIFDELYAIDYRVYQIKPIDAFGGSDFSSIEADNTSAFNCRKATGENRYSKHAYGKAIDINPIENPYVFRSGHISHKQSLQYTKREINNPASVNEKAILHSNDPAVQIFKKYGWRWGDDWDGAKDYQHFDVE